MIISFKKRVKQKSRKRLLLHRLTLRNADVNCITKKQGRLKFLFDNFKRIYLSFSGGKDSGVMLNVTLDYMKRNNIKEKIGVMILDNEANYEYSLEFMHRILKANREYLDIYWCCLPINLPCTVSSYDIEWKCWNNDREHLWVRKIPDEDYVVDFKNHEFDFFRENMNYDEFWDKFGDWYGRGERTACMIGIRTVESLNRFRAIMNLDKEILNGQMWTKRNTEYVYNVYPLYDWKTEDVWIANCKFEWDYNKLYDVFYKAGVPIKKMRVASPFMSESKSSLGLYRVIDPHTWAKLCSRVHGANFIATYGKQLNYKSIKLPEGHTWKSFVKFLLATLPKETAENFRLRFTQSFAVWGSVGRGLSDKIIQELKDNNIEFETNGKTAHGRKTLTRVVIKNFPDHLDMLSCNNGIVASWKRFALTILKNDHTCKYMGFAPTKTQMVRQKQIVDKYKNLNRRINNDSQDIEGIKRNG